MNRKYERAVMSPVAFEMEDIITTSPTPPPPSGGNGGITLPEDQSPFS